MFWRICIFGILLCGFILNDQVADDNSRAILTNQKPRISKLKKVLTIDDSSGKFRLVSPGNFKIAKDGSIFMKDWGKGLYRFSSNGDYLGNLYTKGEGPGELKHLQRYYLGEKAVIQFVHYPNKVVIKDFNGNLKDEFKMPIKGVIGLLGVQNDKYLISKAERTGFTDKLTEKFRPFNYFTYYYLWKYQDKEVVKLPFKTSGAINMKQTSDGFIVSTSSPESTFSVSNLKDGNIFFVNSYDYKISRLSITKKKVFKEFGRSFNKVKYYHSKATIAWMKENNKPIKDPEQKYFRSVLKIINQGDEVWVVTSNVHLDKGILIDVFTCEGIYQDKFFLSVPGLKSHHLPSFYIQDKNLIVLEKDVDENHLIGIYKIQL